MSVANTAEVAAGQRTTALIAEHRSGNAAPGSFDEIERRASAGDREAQHYIGWNLSEGWE